MVADPSSTAGGRPVPDWLVHAAAVAGRLLILGLAVVAVAVLARQLTVVLVPVLVALLLAGVLAPVVERVPPRGPSWLAPLLAVLVVLGVVVGLVAGVGIRLSEELPMLRSEVQGSIDRVSERLGIEVPSVLGGGAGPGGAGGETGGGLDGAAGAVRLGARLLFGFFLTLALAFLFLKDGRALWAWVLDKVGAGVRDRVDAAARSAWSTTGAYVRGLTIVAVFDAVATAAGLIVLGVPLVLALATLQLVLSYVPTIGAFVAGGAAVLVAFASGGMTTAALTLVLVVVVQQVGNDVIEPWVMGRTIGLHPAVVLIAVTAGGVLWGIAGAFLFVPLVAALSAAGHELWPRRRPDPSAPAS